ncbi:hypothetical protein GTO89_04855 [Heliobacterium gestii]|uniref:Uncharacterized protein n=1 Tax=Heliomicrobium gestii TaxID=2699 RepID=A0A845LBS3_HELGE|nr:hypothetical protein [Heliomicrobium gestii]MBM7866947.1 hypothetical protein [Heliomicrobium gestii]MZP42370.1 hypothetical protein [Heliomicrobium gestii]
MGLFPWNNIWEIAIWYALFAGVWHYSDPLAGKMVEQGFLRQNIIWVRLSSLCIGVGFFPIAYLGSELLLTQAAPNRVIDANGWVTSAALMAFSVSLLYAMGRYATIRQHILLEKFLAEWAFDYDHLLMERTWNGHSISELRNLNQQLGIGRIVIATLNANGIVTSLAVRRAKWLHIDAHELFAIDYWLRTEGGPDVAVWYCADEERNPLEAEYEAMTGLVARLSQNRTETRYVLFHNGRQLQCLFVSPSVTPALGEQLTGLPAESSRL